VVKLSVPGFASASAEFLESLAHHGREVLVQILEDISDVVDTLSGAVEDILHLEQVLCAYNVSSAIIIAARLCLRTGSLISIVDGVLVLALADPLSGDANMASALVEEVDVVGASQEVVDALVSCG